MQRTDAIPMDIRVFNESDIASVQELLRILAADFCEPVTITPEQFEATARIILDRSDWYAAFVAESPGTPQRVVGFVSLVFYHTLFHEGRTALINEIGVHPSFRNRGVGGRLIEQAFDETRSRGATEIEVGMIRENTDAARFYRRAGFSEEYVLLGRDL